VRFSPPNFKLIAGQYTLAGTGGHDIGPFTTSITLGPPLNLVGGLPSSVDRSAGLTLTWTGGNPSDVVEITGSSSVTSGWSPDQITDSWSFRCTTSAGAGTFTVPPSVLMQLPPVPSWQCCNFAVFNAGRVVR
jgi:hypothetical protein